VCESQARHSLHASVCCASVANRILRGTLFVFFCLQVTCASSIGLGFSTRVVLTEFGFVCIVCSVSVDYDCYEARESRLLLLSDRVYAGVGSNFAVLSWVCRWACVLPCVSRAFPQEKVTVGAGTARASIMLVSLRLLSLFGRSGEPVE